MDSDDELDKLVTAQVLKARGVGAVPRTSKIVHTAVTSVSNVAAVGTSAFSVGDEELDTLILEALGGRSAMALTPQERGNRVTSGVQASQAGVGGGRNFDDDGKGHNSEVCSHSTLTQGGVQLQKSLLAHDLHGNKAEQPLRQYTTTCHDEGLEDDLLIEALAHLTSPPKQFFSKSQGTGFASRGRQNHQEQQQSPIPSQRLATAPGAAIGAEGAFPVNVVPVDSNHDGEKPVHVRSNSDEILWKALEGEVSAVTGPLSDPLQSLGLPNRTDFSQEMDDEKKILDAILNALKDHQSSVSGDLLHEDDGYDVEAVLRHAEEVAASSLREMKGGENRIMHLHEHIEMREELQRARGSFGWPSCVCMRPTPFATTTTTTAPLSTSFHSSVSPSLSWSRRPLLCIGTTLGIVLLFNAKRKICGICGSVSSSAVETRGAVVALSVLCDTPMMLSGHERGTLLLWDTNTLTVLREITEEYNTPITRLCHCQMDPFRALVLDSTGSVKLLSFTRIMTKMTYRLNKVATSSMEAPFNDVDIIFLKGEELYVVGAVSTDTLLVSALDCGFQNVATPIMRRTQLPGSTHACELLRFLCVPQDDQVLMCVTLGTVVNVFSIAAGGVLSELRRVANVRLERPVHAMGVISGCCILLDQSDTLHLLNVSVAIVLEERPLNRVEPVFFSSRICGTRYGGALVGNGTEVVILGRHRVFTCTLLSWKDRLDALVEQERYLEALELAKAFALEVALGVVGLDGDAATRRASICSYITGLIKAFLSHAIQRTPSHEDTIGSITCVIELCSEVDAMDVFFGPTMELLRTITGGDALALYSLERCILSGTVTSLPEVYIQPFFDLLAEKSPSKPIRAERALIRLDNCSELLLHIAERHNLVRLAVAILSYRQCRYDEAFRFALKNDRLYVDDAAAAAAADNNNDDDDDSDPNCGMALCFFECTMKGYTVIEGTEISEQQRCAAKRQLWHHLISVTEDMEAILHQDPERTLRTIFSSLQEEGSYSLWIDHTMRMKCISHLFVHLLGMDLSTNATLRPWDLATREWPPYAVVHQLLTGVMHLVLTGVVVLDDLQSFCEHVCSHLIYQFQTSENEVQRQNIQSDVASLFTSLVTRTVCFEFAEEELRQQRMFRALAALHCTRLEYKEVIDCYLEKESAQMDPDMPKDVFRVLRDEMNRAVRACNEDAVQRIRDAVMHRVSVLVDINATLLAQFVFDYLPGNHKDVMDILRNSAETFLRYLNELVAKGEPAVANDAKLQNTYIDLMCSHDPERVYPYLHSQDNIITYDLHHALQAVKRHKVDDAAVFLLEKTHMINEAMEILVDTIVKKLQNLRIEVINHVISYFDEAPDRPSLTISSLSSASKRWEGVEMGSINNKRVKEMTGDNPKHGDDMRVWAGEGLLQQVLDVGINLCSRYSDDCVSQASEKWFSLLGIFTVPRRLLCNRQGEHNAALQFDSIPVDGFDNNEIYAALASDKPSTGKRFPLLSSSLSPRGVMFLELMIALYTKYASQLLMHMVKVLDPSKVVERIVEDYERERFGPLKPVIIDIMSSLSFELEFNRLCRFCIDEDTMMLGLKLHTGLNTGIVPLSDTCYICGRGLGDVSGAAEAEGSVRIYACGHGFHESCALKNGKGGAECIHCHMERRGNTGEHTGLIHRGIFTPGSNTEGHTDVCRGEDNVLSQDDLPLLLRRLKHTRAKIDGARGYRNVLWGFLSSSDVSTIYSGFLKESTGKRLLAPAPPPPIHLDCFSSEDSVLNLDNALTVALTDEELLELFGTVEEGGTGSDRVEIGVFSSVDETEFGL